MSAARDTISTLVACLEAHEAPSELVELASKRLSWKPFVVAACLALHENTSSDQFDYWNELRRQRLGAGDAALVAWFLARNSSCVKLSLEYNGIGERGATAIAEALQPNATLRVLRLEGNRITSYGLTALCGALRANRSLKKLYVNENDLGAPGASALADALLLNDTLSLLNLGDNGIGPDGGKAVSTSLRETRSLQWLGLCNNGIGARGAEDLGMALQSNSTLQVLDLEGNAIGDAGATALSRALTLNTTLRSLDIASNGITNAGLFAMAEALRVNSTLIDLEGLSLDTKGLLRSMQLPLELRGRGTREVMRYLRSIAPVAQQPQLSSGCSAQPRPSRSTDLRGKVILLGPGGSGKTHLCHSLMGLPPPSGQPTDGIEVRRWAPDSDHVSRVQLQLWDFAGQAVYFNTHPFFFSRRSLYLLVINPRRDHDVREVLNLLHWVRRESPSSPVLLVCTHLDAGAGLRLPRELDEVIPPTDCFRVSSVTGDGIGKLASAVVERVRQDHGTEMRIAPELRRLESHLLMERECGRRMVLVVDALQAAGYEETSTGMLHLSFLHAWGEVLHYADHAAFADRLILSPQWLADVMAAVVTAFGKGEAQAGAVARGEAAAAVAGGPDVDVSGEAVLGLLEGLGVMVRGRDALGAAQAWSWVPCMLPGPHAGQPAKRWSLRSEARATGTWLREATGTAAPARGRAVGARVRLPAPELPEVSVFGRVLPDLAAVCALRRAWKWGASLGWGGAALVVHMETADLLAIRSDSSEPGTEAAVVLAVASLMHHLGNGSGVRLELEPDRCTPCNALLAAVPGLNPGGGGGGGDSDSESDDELGVGTGAGAGAGAGGGAGAGVAPDLPPSSPFAALVALPHDRRGPAWQAFVVDAAHLAVRWSPAADRWSPAADRGSPSHDKPFPLVWLLLPNPGALVNWRTCDPARWPDDLWTAVPLVEDCLARGLVPEAAAAAPGKWQALVPTPGPLRLPARDVRGCAPYFAAVLRSVALHGVQGLGAGIVGADWGALADRIAATGRLAGEAEPSLPRVLGNAWWHVEHLAPPAPLAPFLSHPRARFFSAPVCMALALRYRERLLDPDAWGVFGALLGTRLSVRPEEVLELVDAAARADAGVGAGADVGAGEEAKGDASASSPVPGLLRGHERVAVKRLHAGTSVDGLLREAEALAAVSSDHVVAIRGVCLDPASLDRRGRPVGVALLMQMGGRLLREAADAEGGLSWFRRVGAALQVARGLRALHEQAPPVLHRDLKLENVVVDELGWVVRLANFGLAADATKAARAGNLGTAKLVAPELWRDRTAASPASDMYALGVLLHELLGGRRSAGGATGRLVGSVPAWEGEPDVGGAVLAGRRPVWPEEVAAALSGREGVTELQGLVQRLWAADPGQRPSAAEAEAVLSDVFARCRQEVHWREGSAGEETVVEHLPWHLGELQRDSRMARPNAGPGSHPYDPWVVEWPAGTGAVEAIKHLRQLMSPASFDFLQLAAMEHGASFLNSLAREHEFLVNACRLSERYRHTPPPRPGDGPFDAMWCWKPSTAFGRRRIEQLRERGSLRVAIAGEEAEVLEKVHARWLEVDDLVLRCESLTQRRLGGVRACVVFHGTTRTLAQSIMRSGFAVMGALDPGFFGSGIYVTTDVAYAREYAYALAGAEGRGAPVDVVGGGGGKGEGGDGGGAAVRDGAVGTGGDGVDAGAGRDVTPAVLVCIACVGHTRPLNGRWYGLPLGPGYDSHVVFVQNTTAGQHLAGWEPVGVKEWSRRPTYCELVVRESGQLLPLAMIGI